MDIMRVLVSGSRRWSDVETIREALSGFYSPGAVLVSGACPSGADAIAERIWTELGGTVERHPADWRKHGKAAGMMRNREMISLGADILIGFCLDNSPGTTNTIRLAKRVGIPTTVYAAQSQNINRPEPPVLF
jgi:hypothetical protein